MLPHQEDEPHHVRIRRRIDSMLAVLAAVATIGFAWTGFQGAAWLRERFSEADRASELTDDALALTTRADSVQERDAILYVEWVSAVRSGEEETAESVYALFRPEIRQYIEEAETTADGLPPTPPSTDEDYDVTQWRSTAQNLREAAETHEDATDRASGIGARYGGIGIIFAAVLASTGIATRFEGHGVRRGFILIGTALTAVALVLLAFTPVTLG